MVDGLDGDHGRLASGVLGIIAIRVVLHLVGKEGGVRQGLSKGTEFFSVVDQLLGNIRQDAQVGLGMSQP